MGKFLRLIIIIIVGLFLNNIAYAETLIWKKPLDFELNLTQAGTYESACIRTPAVITEVTANWGFQGEVSLEISADGAKHYLRVVNGQPLLIPPVHQGNRLHYKVHLAKNSSISYLRLTYTDTLADAFTFGNPQLSGFRYRIPISITYTGESKKGLFNYPVKITIAGAKEELKGPVRWTAADGKRLLFYYRFHHKGSKRSCPPEFWVKVPQIPKDGTTIYLYYGNPQAKDLSNGDKVFEFFDDFNSQVLDEQKWQFLSDLKGAGSLKDGKLNLLDSEIKSVQFSLKPKSVIEFKAHTLDAYTDIQAVLNELVFYSSNFSGAKHAIAKNGQVKKNLDVPLEIGKDYLYQISYLDGKLVFSRRPSKGNKACLTFPSLPSGKTLVLSLKSTSTSDYRKGAYFDWIRVRPSLEAKPYTVSVGEAHSVNLASYSGKHYVSELAPVDFPVRIVTVEGLSQENLLFLSANGGRNYTKEIKPAKFYYASKGDFKPGKCLRWKMKLSQGQVLPKELKITYYPGKITLLSPNGKEKFSAGSKREILWSAQEYQRSYPLRLEYSLDEGRSYQLIAEGISNSASYIWHIPKELKGKILLKISDFYSPEVYDVSDDYIEIE